MSRSDEPIPSAPHDWVSFARELADAGWWADAVTAYESALGVLGIDGGFEGALRGFGGALGGLGNGGTGVGTSGASRVAGAGSWQVELLGGFEIRDAGGPVDLAGLRPQHRQLLQVFCVFAGRPLSDRRLCAWFWPDADQDRARHRLAVGVSALRSLPGGPVVERVGAGYRLLTADLETDVGRFERRLAAARVVTGAQRVARLEEAFAAYRGPLLPDAGSDEWVQDERDRLRDAAVDVAAELAERHAKLGRPRDVVRVARAGLRIDRHHDRLWRRLVTALTALGEPAAAATARQEYTAVLADLGVVTLSPMPARHRASA